LFKNVDALRWRGPRGDFEAWAAKVNAPKLVERARSALGKSRLR
jgi:hypothetical protein